MNDVGLPFTVRALHTALLVVTVALADEAFTIDTT